MDDKFQCQHHIFILKQKFWRFSPHFSHLKSLILYFCTINGLIVRLVTNQHPVICHGNTKYSAFNPKQVGGGGALVYMHVWSPHIHAMCFNYFFRKGNIPGYTGCVLIYDHRPACIDDPEHLRSTTASTYRYCFPCMFLIHTCRSLFEMKRQRRCTVCRPLI